MSICTSGSHAPAWKQAPTLQRRVCPHGPLERPGYVPTPERGNEIVHPTDYRHRIDEANEPRAAGETGTGAARE